MTTVNNNVMAIIKAQDALGVAELKATELVKTSKAKMVDLVITTVGEAPTYDGLMGFRTEFTSALEGLGVASGTASQRYTRLMKAVEADDRYNFERPASTNADAERKAKAKGEFANLNEAEVQELYAEAIASKDYKTIAKLGREQEKREKMLERADKQKDKVARENLLATFKELDLPTLQLLNWTLYHQKEVKALIKQ